MTDASGAADVGDNGSAPLERSIDWEPLKLILLPCAPAEFEFEFEFEEFALEFASEFWFGR